MLSTSGTAEEAGGEWLPANPLASVEAASYRNGQHSALLAPYSPSPAPTAAQLNAGAPPRSNKTPQHSESTGGSYEALLQQIDSIHNSSGCSHTSAQPTPPRPPPPPLAMLPQQTVHSAPTATPPVHEQLQILIWENQR